MKNVLVSGCNGHMGQILCRMIGEEADMQVVAGVDKNVVQKSTYDFEVYSTIDRTALKEVDVIIDFSSPSLTPTILDAAEFYNTPMVIATTGLTEEIIDLMKFVAKTVPIFYSANMSYDVCVFRRILEVAVPLLKNTDIEITEEHHNRKADSPSGTAEMLANAINESLGNEKTIIYGRTSKRDPNEIGISSVRGGNICGTHTVHFFGDNDILEIKHTALSRDVFAEGAIRAAKFITEDGREPRLYSMTDLF